MPNDVLGVPLHPLIVHAVVVLVPLAAMGVLAVTVVPGLRQRFGWLVAVTVAADVLLVPLATSSGESLEKRVQRTALVERHAHLAEQLLPWVLALAAGIVVTVLLEHLAARRAGNGGTPWWGSRPVVVLALALTVAGSAGSLVQVVRIGHIGAKATWGPNQWRLRSRGTRGTERGGRDD